jgi:DNA (cytosine-5)-methyltransferase 1
VLKVAGFFAGIGGFEHGLSGAGFEAELLCEIDPSAQTVLRARFPESRVVDDIRAVDRVDPSVGLLTAGFPCQDISTSGGKIGIEGLRSGLIHDVFRILRASSVDWVILENVKNLLNLGAGEGMRIVVEGLEALGYRWAYRLVDSFSFGLPQKRRRVFFVASRTGDPRNVILADDAPQQKRADASLDEPVGFYWTEGRYGASVTRDGIPTIKTGSTVGIPSPPAILMPDGTIGTPDIRDAERLQGFPEGWTEAAENVSRGARWKLLGNAVSVPVTRWIGERIVEPGVYDFSSDLPFDAKGKWPSAAWNDGNGRFSSSVSEYPLATPQIGLRRFLHHPLKPLSAKASNGFATRVEASGVRYPEGFKETVRRYAVKAAVPA